MPDQKLDRLASHPIAPNEAEPAMAGLNVLFDGRVISDHFPGIGRYAYHLAGALAEQAELHITLLHDPSTAGTRYNLDRLTECHPRLTRYPVAAAPFTLAEQLRVAPRVRALKCDVWHSLNYVMPYAGLPRPIVLTLYDLIPLALPEHWSATNRLLYRLMHRLALRTASRIITLSDAARRDLIHFFHVPPERLCVIPAAVDTRFKPAAPADIESIRRHYQLPASYLLYVGINKPPKNLVRLIEAFARLVEALPDFSGPCVIAGAWDDRYSEAKQRTAQLGLGQRVRFLGPIPDADLPTLYSGAEVFVTASLYEGFGFPALEALACGAPVACSRTSSLPEVVGDAGLLFDPYDVDAIVAALKQLLTDPSLRDTLRRRGLERAAQFTWARTAQQTLEVYRQVQRVSPP